MYSAAEMSCRLTEEVLLEPRELLELLGARDRGNLDAEELGRGGNLAEDVDCKMDALVESSN